MGMFDEVKCLYPLPLPQYQNYNFQSKDLECELMDVEIREDGTLWSRGSFLEKQGREESKWRQRIYTGEFNFYTFAHRPTEPEPCDPNFDKGWIEFIADFQDGQLTEIRLLTEVKPRKLKRRKR